MRILIYSETISGLWDEEKRFRERVKGFDLLRTIGRDAAEKNIPYADAVVYDGDGNSKILEFLKNFKGLRFHISKLDKVN